MMSRKSERRKRQKQQRQLLQSSQSSQPSPPPPQDQQQEPLTPSWRRSPSFLKTLETIEEGRQADFRQPIFCQEPQGEYSSYAFKVTFFIVSVLLFQGVAIGHAIKWLAPKAIGPIRLALKVFVVEMVNLVLELPFNLVHLLQHIMTEGWSFLDYTVTIMLTTLIISYLGTRYILRQEYVLLSLSLFYCLSAMPLLAPFANRFPRLAQFNPHGDGYESDEDTYSVEIVSAEEEFRYIQAHIA
ncbi:hypothetical protein GGI43DRAFT_290281 [Trichoderma evansii]